MPPTQSFFRRSTNYIHGQGVRGALSATSSSLIGRIVLLGCMAAALIATAAVVKELRKPFSPNLGGRVLMAGANQMRTCDCPPPTPEDAQTATLRILLPQEHALQATLLNSSAGDISRSGSGSKPASSAHTHVRYGHGSSGPGMHHPQASASVANAFKDVYWGETELQPKQLGRHLQAKLDQQLFCSTAYPLNDPTMRAAVLPRMGQMYVYRGNDFVSKTISDGSLWEMDSLRAILWAMEQPLPPCSTIHRNTSLMQDAPEGLKAVVPAVDVAARLHAVGSSVVSAAKGIAGSGNGSSSSSSSSSRSARMVAQGAAAAGTGTGRALLEASPANGQGATTATSTHTQAVSTEALSTEDKPPMQLASHAEKRLASSGSQSIGAAAPAECVSVLTPGQPPVASSAAAGSAQAPAALRDSLFVDIGANVGWFMCNVASKGYRVAAFEGLPANVRLLRSTLCANPSWGHRALLFAHGLGRKADRCYTFSSDSNRGDGFTLCGLSPQQAAAHVATQPGYSLRGQMDVERLDGVLDEDVKVLKMDVEGYEPYVLLGAYRLLMERRVWYLVIEYNPFLLRAAYEQLPGFNLVTHLYHDLRYSISMTSLRGPWLSPTDVRLLSMQNAGEPVNLYCAHSALFA